MKHKSFLGLLLLLSLNLSASTNDGDPLPGDGNDPIETEAPVPETRIPDPLDVPLPGSQSDFIDGNLPPHGGKKLEKTQIPQFLAETCLKIRTNRARFPMAKISRGTQYFTPMFEPGENGRLQEQDRRSCINVEGSCIVNTLLYNWDGKDKPWGKVYQRSQIPFKFGKGNGKNYYNKTNSLDPCRTLAADQQSYPVGTVIYVPSMLGQICPQSGQPIDGCFIVGDVGAAIKGEGRFDFFTGECADYNRKSSTCNDPGNKAFGPKAGDPFYVIGRHNLMAKELREETDLFIQNGWSKELFPIPDPE